MVLTNLEKSTIPVLNDYFKKIQRFSYNQIEFEDNMYVDFITFASSGAVGTSHLLAHGLNRTPAGFVVTCTLSGTTYGSGGVPPWDEDYINLIVCGSGATIMPVPGSGDTVTVMVF